MKNSYASPESQIGNDICTVEDTEEIFWLKMSDDYQSMVKAGDLLAGQYRFKDAVNEYKKALQIKQNDFMLYIKLGGAYLTLFDFEEAEESYNQAMICGAKEDTVAFYFGIKNFLAGNYSKAIEYFEKTNVNSGEMLISVIYWHTIASLRQGTKPTFLKKYDENTDVGHHTAYRTAVRIFADKDSADRVVVPDYPLDAVIVLYALYEYFLYQNKTADAKKYLHRALAYKEVWPCIAYLACYNENKKQNAF